MITMSPEESASAGRIVPVPTISSTVPDWSREAKPLWRWDPARSLLASLRAYERHGQVRSPWHLLMRKVHAVRHRFWSVVTGADIPLGTQIGGGLLLPHPNGIVIHPQAVLGPNCLVFQQVTIGMAGGRVPTVGGHVDIGAGAKVLGGITVGEHSRIGANALVIRDVAAHATVVAPEARVL
jgi:serine O-acetyltransferase